MDYLKTVVPSQLVSERGSNLVVINPGSANIKIGLAQQDSPLNIPHCIARRTSQNPKRNVKDQMLNSQVTTAQHVEREKAYDIIASLLKIPFLDEEVANNSYPRKMGRVDGYNPQNSRKDVVFSWTDVHEKEPVPSSAPDSLSSMNKGVTNEPGIQRESTDSKELNSSELKLREFICGEEALRISPTEPYCLNRPIRRGHLNVSQHYPVQQVFEDLYAIWNWILTEKLHIPLSERNLYSAILVVPETFDNREIKEMLTIVLRDLRFSSAVVHQEGLAAVFGNGLSTACVINMGAQVTSVICVEDGVALPNTEKTLPFGGEDISRCLLWTQRHHQTWPQIRTDILTKPMDLLMLNKLKESYCEIKEGEVDAVAVVRSYEDGLPPGSHKTRLTALNVPPMGLFYPKLFVPDVYPAPPCSCLVLSVKFHFSAKNYLWKVTVICQIPLLCQEIFVVSCYLSSMLMTYFTRFNDYEDMLEDTWHTEFPRRSDISDGFLPGVNVGLPMWESYPVLTAKPKKEEKIGLAEAVTSSILSTGRIDLQRKLFCSIQLIGGVALTGGLIPAVEERVLHAIPPNEAIDMVEILGILDFSRDAWIHREDWVRNGIHIGSGRKYKDSYFLQAQAMCYINS